MTYSFLARRIKRKEEGERENSSSLITSLLVTCQTSLERTQWATSNFDLERRWLDMRQHHILVARVSNFLINIKNIRRWSCPQSSLLITKKKTNNLKIHKYPWLQVLIFLLLKVWKSLYCFFLNIKNQINPDHPVN